MLLPLASRRACDVSPCNLRRTAQTLLNWHVLCTKRPGDVQGMCRLAMPIQNVEAPAPVSRLRQTKLRSVQDCMCSCVPCRGQPRVLHFYGPPKTFLHVHSPLVCQRTHILQGNQRGFAFFNILHGGLKTATCRLADICEDLAQGREPRQLFARVAAQEQVDVARLFPASAFHIERPTRSHLCGIYVDGLHICVSVFQQIPFLFAPLTHELPIEGERSATAAKNPFQGIHAHFKCAQTSEHTSNLNP